MQNQQTRAAVADAPRLPRALSIAAIVLLLASLALTVPSDGEWWKVVVLGIIQGITEWLPISSTGHLLIAADLLRFQGSIGGTFEIFIQLGTVLSVVVFYLNDLLGQARGVLGQGTPAQTAAARRLWIAVLIAFAPAAAIGLAFRTLIKQYLFDAPLLIAGALIVGGLVLLVVERLPLRASASAELDAIRPRQALGIGIAQVFALVPGVSRSGSSIVGGLLAGLDRRTATAFSFYLSVPTLGAATLVDLLGSLDQIQPADWGRLLLGAVVAMIVGYLTIGWLLRYVSRNSFVAFGAYRLAVGALILALVAMGVL